MSVSHSRWWNGGRARAAGRVGAAVAIVAAVGAVVWAVTSLGRADPATASRWGGAVTFVVPVVTVAGPVLALLWRYSLGPAASPVTGTAAGSADEPSANLMPSPPGALFTGRDEELARVGAVVDHLENHGGVAVLVLWGMAGVGKTHLATAAAAHYGDRFDGPVLPFELGGFSGTPQKATDKLAEVLQQVAGVGAEELRDADARRRRLMWLDWTSRHQGVLVLDDALSYEHVKDLIPGSGTYLVLVTSRHRTDIHLHNCSLFQQIRVDALAPAEATVLAERVLGREAIGAERATLDAAVRWCDGLPLAVRLLAAQLRDYPGAATRWLADLQRRETPESRKISEAIMASVERLDPVTRRVFGLLGLHPPGCDLDYAAVAALAGTEGIDGYLRALCDASLLNSADSVEATAAHPLPPGGGPRFRMHDLVRETARRMTGEDETAAATDRLFTHYWRATAAAAAAAEPLLSRYTRPEVDPPGPERGADCGRWPEATTRTVALDWFERYRPHLLACREAAVAAHRHLWVVRLTRAMAGFLRNNGPWDVVATWHAEAAEAAGMLDDVAARAAALNDQGIVLRLLGQYATALPVLAEAHRVFTGDLRPRVFDDDRLRGQANALNEIGIVHNLREEYDQGVRALRQALRLYQATGDQMGVANAAKNLAVGRYHIGLRDRDPVLRSDALVMLDSAAAGYAAIGDLLGQAEVFNHRGVLRLRSDAVDAALRDFTAARALADQVGTRLETARAWEGTGRCRERFGDLTGAVAALAEAERIYSRVSAEEAHRVVVKELSELRDQLPG